jgi:hypothetical protein
LAGLPELGPFKYHDRGAMATIGHKYAVADAFGRKVTGLPAYLMWGFVHVAYLVGWGNRLGTIYTWGRALYLSKNRAHRIITFDTARSSWPRAPGCPPQSCPGGRRRRVIQRPPRFPQRRQGLRSQQASCPLLRVMVWVAR